MKKTNIYEVQSHFVIYSSTRLSPNYMSLSMHIFSCLFLFIMMLLGSLSNFVLEPQQEKIVVLYDIQHKLILAERKKKQ